MREDVVLQYQKAFGELPSIVLKSPGRINIIGEHIDYNDGFVLPAAIDKGIYFAMSLGEKTELIAYQRGERLDDFKRPDWAIYIDAIRKELSKEGIELSHIRVVFGADLPSGAGLSSSSALCVGLWFGINEMMQLGYSNLEIALLAQRTEQATGIQCGLMDQFTITHAQAGCIIKLDCVDNSYEIFKPLLEGSKFVLLNTRVDHHLTSSAYNDRRRVAHDARDKMRAAYPSIRSFRDISLNHIYSAGLSQDEKDLSTFVIEEIKRVEQMVIALKENDLIQIACLLNNGHIGLRDLYKVTCAETDFIQEEVIKRKGMYAARQMGGGFGGCMLLLVDQDLPFRQIECLMQDYHQQTGIQSQYFPVRIDDGVRLI